MYKSSWQYALGSGAATFIATPELDRLFQLFGLSDFLATLFGASLASAFAALIIYRVGFDQGRSSATKSPAT